MRVRPAAQRSSLLALLQSSRMTNGSANRSSFMRGPSGMGAGGGPQRGLITALKALGAAEREVEWAIFSSGWGSERRRKALGRSPLILRHLDEIGRKLDRMLEELRTPTARLFGTAWQFSKEGLMARRSKSLA